MLQCLPTTESPAKVPAQATEIQRSVAEFGLDSAIENATVSPMIGRNSDNIVKPRR